MRNDCEDHSRYEYSDFGYSNFYVNKSNAAFQNKENAGSFIKIRKNLFSTYLDGSTVFLYAGLRIARKMKARTEQLKGG